MKKSKSRKFIQRAIVFPQLKHPLNIARQLENKKTIVNQKTSNLHYLMSKCNRSKNDLVEWMLEFQKEKKSAIVLSSKQIAEIRYRKDNNQINKSKSMIDMAKKDSDKSVGNYSELEKLQIRLNDSEYLKKYRLKSMNLNNSERVSEERTETLCNIKRGRYHCSFGKPIYIRINPFNKEL